MAMPDCTLRGVIGGQIVRWRNSRSETRWTLARRLFWSVRFWLQGQAIGLRAIRATQLGSRVRYQGELWRISNWSNSPRSTLAKQDGYVENVPREDFTPERSVREFLHRFRVGRDHYLGYWHCIDVDRRIRRVESPDA